MATTLLIKFRTHDEKYELWPYASKRARRWRRREGGALEDRGSRCRGENEREMPSSHKRKAKAKAKAKAALTLGSFIKDVRVCTQGGGRAGPEADMGKEVA